MGDNNNAQAEAGLAQANLSAIKNQYLDISLPAIQKVLDQYMKTLGTPGQEPTSVVNAFAQSRSGANAAYDTAEQRSSAGIATRAKSMGLDFRPDAVFSAQSGALTSLEQDRASTMRDLSTQEASIGLQQTDQLLSSMGNIEKTLLQASLGMGGNAVSTLGMMPSQSPWLGAGEGAVSGAASGAAAGPYGALFGALIGGASGYFGSQGGG